MTAIREPYPPTWVAESSYTRGRTTITRGQRVKIRGQRGEFVFWDHVINPPAGRRRTPREWVTVVGPADVKQFRAFRPADIVKVLKTQ
jgi:hypothetical protein